jgi:hypothetical protein
MGENMKYKSEEIDSILKTLRKNNVLGFELGEFKVTFKADQAMVPMSEVSREAKTDSWEDDIGMQKEDDFGGL